MSTNFLAGKVALITGSSSGLGQAIAERYAALGADVVVHYSKSKAEAEAIVSTTVVPTPGMAVYGGSKMGGRYVVDVLAKEIGHRGVTVNSLIPYAIDGSGVFADPAAFPEARKALIDASPMGRMGTLEDVANLAEFFASDLSSLVNGQHLMANGGANG